LFSQGPPYRLQSRHDQRQPLARPGLRGARSAL